MSTTPATRWHKVALTGGFIAVGGAVHAARRAPATGYEVSIYAGTPDLFWAGVAVALVAALLVAAAAPREWPGVAGAGLGGTAVLAIVALPALRSYHFYGSNDALTHLGWVRELAAGALAPQSLIYPGGHVVASSLGSLGGVPFRLSMQLVVVALVAAYLLSVPLLAHRLAGDRRVTLLAAFGGLLLLPVNHSGFQLLFYPFALATFLAPLVLYLLVEHAHGGVVPRAGVTRAGWLRRSFGTRAGALFALLGVGTVLYHPQVATDLIALAAGVVAVQALAGRSDRLRPGRPVAGLTAVVGVAFLAWSLRLDSFRSVARLGLEGLAVLVTGGEVAGAIDRRSESASAVGGGLSELAAKLFLVDALALALGAVAVLVVARGWLYARDDERTTLVAFLAAGVGVVGLYAAVHLLGPLSEVNFFFRHQGFLLVPLTVLGALGIAWLGDGLGSRVGPERVRVAAPAVGAVVLALALVVAFPSPYVFLPSQHVTEAEMTGHRVGLSHADGLVVVGVRGGPERFDESDPTIDARTGEPVGAETLRAGVGSLYGGDVLLAVTERDRQREVIAYRSLRFTEDDFASVGRDGGTSRVVATGEYTLYHVNGTAPDA